MWQATKIMYACMYVRMYLPIPVSMYVFIYVCMDIPTCTNTYVYTYLYNSTCVDLRGNVYGRK